MRPRYGLQLHASCWRTPRLMRGVMRTENMMIILIRSLAVAVCTAMLTVATYAAVEAVNSCCGPCDATLCGAPTIDPRGSMKPLLDKAPIVFLGMVVRAETLACCDRWADVTFRISKGYKAMVLPAVTLRTGGGCARPFPFAIGREYLVAATWSVGPPMQYHLYCGFSPLEAESAPMQIRDLDALLQVQTRPEAAE